VGADLLTASGELLHVTDETNPELMWGLRGAGANFGVVTSFELRLHPVRPLMLAGLIAVPNDGDGARDIARGFRDYIEQAPEDLAAALITGLAPPEDFVPPELVGKPVLLIVVAWLGDPDEAEDAIRPVRRLTAGGIDLVQPMPYTALQALLDPNNPPGMLNYHRGMHLTSLTDEVIDRYLENGRDIGSPLTGGVIFHHGGAIAGVGENDTAVSDRNAPYMAHPIACWDDPADTDREIAWVHDFTDAVSAARTGHVYLNFEPETGEENVRAGFSAGKYERLAALKAQWDPENLFSGNHNVPPAPAG
jgi:FAD/FMN-containing dehydrogenase